MEPENHISFAVRSARLADEARQGSQIAFGQLLQLWHPRLLAFARLKAGSEAEDVLQSASLTLAQSIHRLQDPTRFGPFAMTIIVRRSADMVGANQRERRRRAALSDQPEGPAPDPVRQLALRQALSQMPADARTLLTLHHVEGLTGTDLAKLLNLPLGTVKSRLHAARKRLRQIYEGDSNG